MTISANAWKEQISAVELFGKTAEKIAEASEAAGILGEAVVFVTALLNCDACTIYFLENDDLVLRASVPSYSSTVSRVSPAARRAAKSASRERGVVMISEMAYQDARFKLFNDGSRGCFQAFLSVPMVSQTRQIGVINALSNSVRKYHQREIDLVSTLACLVASRIQAIRLWNENADLALRLESCDDIERATRILKADLGLQQEEAYLLLQRESRQRRKPMREIAAAIVLGDRLKNSSEYDNPSSETDVKNSESLSKSSEV